MAFLKKSDKYNWQFENIGGSTRVRITCGEDIRHISELDPKMWTVLSCPVTGLEIDEKSMTYADSDKDGKIRVTDITVTANWLTNAVKNPDILLTGADCIDINEFNTENTDGNKLFLAAKEILRNLGKENTVISLNDTADIAAIFAKTRFNGDGIITESSSDNDDDKDAIKAILSTAAKLTDRSGEDGVNSEMIEAFYKDLSLYAGWIDSAPEAPYGDMTEKVLEAYKALDAKVKDFFMRSRLAAFSPQSTNALDIQTSRIEAISPGNLTDKMDEIASYPLAHITGRSELELEKGINPVWAGNMTTLSRAVWNSEKKVITEDDWTELGKTLAAWSEWKSSKTGAGAEPLGEAKVRELLEKNRKESLLGLVAQDASLKEESDNIENVDKFLHLLRDFGRLLRNFVTFQDFYDKNSRQLAVFQCGRLIIDQRECHFCLKVSDMAKHNQMAASSGMFLVYCDCTTKTRPGKLQIVAAVTVGDIGDLKVGKNAIYYDNSGLEWDAVITKVIDNPISIGQAFWSPYRKMASAVENLINKNAADKDAKVIKDATAKLNSAPKITETATAPTQAQPFDIGKFAGIFAALGMAVGMIGSALASLVKGVAALKWWEVVLAFTGIMLLISGPAMVIAWMKLRRRNIAPLLNANGWAINASSKISIMFGETLTDIAKFPKLKLKDPYARKGMAVWKRWTILIASLIVVLAALWICNLFSWAKLPSPLPFFNKDTAQENVVVQETITVEDVTE